MPGKVKYNQLSEFERKKYLGEFYTMVSLLKSRDEVKEFFKDLLTLSEVVMVSRRLQAAKMLLEGFTCDEVSRKMKMGLTTISQVEKWLNNGFGGYKKVIRRYKNKEIPKKDFSSAPPFSLQYIKRKYPLHFLLLNLMEKEK